MLAFNISSEFLHFKDNESCGPASSSIQSPINKNLSIYLGSMYVLIPFSLINILIIKRCIIVTVVGFLGNLLTLLSIPWARHNGLYGFSDHPSKHTSIFVLNLAFADFLYCVTSLPLNAFTVTPLSSWEIKLSFVAVSLLWMAWRTGQQLVVLLVFCSQKYKCCLSFHGCWIDCCQ